MNHQTAYAELNHLLEIYHLHEVHPTCFGVNQRLANGILKTMSNFANGRTIKSPDIYANSKNIIGIEHFEYDTSRKTRHGSAERLGIERANREFLKEAHEAATYGRGLSISYEIKTDSNVAALKENFLHSFRKHKHQISIYKSNLESVFGVDDAPIWFLVEDTSTIGPSFSSHFIIDGHPRIPLLPVFYKDVQKEILQSSIDGAIFISSFPISHFVVFIANNPSSFEELVKHYHFSEDLPIDFFDDLPYYFSSFCVP